MVRRLTLTETCRLQAFPDDWNGTGLNEHGAEFAQSDSARFRQLGNAVTVNVAEWIARRLAATVRS